VGDGPLAKQIKEYKKPKNLFVSLIGNIDYPEMPKYYAQAGVFVFPSLKDEWGLVVNEALVSGLPVLGSVYSQAVEELVRDGENGWQFHPDNLEEIYQILEKIYSLSDDDLLKMRIASRKSISDLSPEIIAEKLIHSLNKSSKGELLN
jgi:glycosyltransferase involved in cell wall biosynthesis